MIKQLANMSLVVRDYDEAIQWFTEKHDSLVKTPSSSGGNGRIMWGKGVGAAPGRGRGACSERETRKRASGSPSSW